jgi:dinuclear metal center YbgI/SA1388 family protein
MMSSVMSKFDSALSKTSSGTALGSALSMVSLQDLERWCDSTLSVSAFKDYAPNGLQVEGNPQVSKIVTGVTASLSLIEAAISEKADAILVHHGYFWKNENPCLTGMKAQRIRRLLKENISLLAYHLPLDAHPTLGNNVAFAELMGFKISSGLDPDEKNPIGFIGQSTPMTASAMADLLTSKLGCTPRHLAGGPQTIVKVAWCTGGAQDFIQQAAKMGCDAYFSGEVSERTFHEAAELGIHYFGCGHHATERGGIMRLGQAVAAQFGIPVQFIDIENPV